MSLRTNLRWLGLITLVGFPIPSVLTLYFLEGQSMEQIFQIDKFNFPNIILGLSTGVFCGILIYWITRHPIFKNIPLKVEEMIRDAKLNMVDALFLSLAAGLGEEMLFRAGVQHYLGVISTSILFVAIHGYFSIKKPKISLYGLLVLPFILLLGYGYIHVGLWFSISAHFSYDLLLFIIIMKQKDNISIDF